MSAALHGVLHIGAAAEHVGCCPRTLVNYVARGRIPDRRDSANRRIFTPHDLLTVNRLMRI